jgi:hypothetical protein
MKSVSLRSSTERTATMTICIGTYKDTMKGPPFCTHQDCSSRFSVDAINACHENEEESLSLVLLMSLRNSLTDAWQ